MRFTKSLTIYAAAGVIGLVGWVLNSSQLYWMSGVLVLLPWMSRLFGLMEHRGLAVQRRLPYAAHQGETVSVRYIVRNLSSIPKLQLSLGDSLPAGLVAEDPEPVPVHLASYGADEVEYRLRLLRRGLHRLETVRVQSTDVLGIHALESSLPCVSEILVYPRITDLPEWALPPELAGGQAPLEATRRKGEGSGFFGLREYRPGDPLRHVHWRTAARLGRLAVVEWESEESIDALIAVETLRGSERELGSGTTLDLAAGLAGSLADGLLASGGALRLLAPGASEWRPSPERGTEALADILDRLARMRAAAEQSVAAELRLVAPQLAPGTLVCWLAPNPDDQLVAAAGYLRAANLRPVVYALDTAPAGRPGAWDAVEAQLQAVQIPVVRLHPDDDLVRTLLATE